MYNLKVTLDKDSGFCFGVVYAVEMAEEILESEDQLYCLGDIVHNDMEVERLAAMGLKVISHEEFKQLRHTKVLIRAHGEPPETYLTAMENDLKLIDASCPVVLKLQNRIRNSYTSGDCILIYGKKDHAEVIGLQGQTFGTAIVFEDVEDLDLENLPRNVTLYSQTTKNKRTLHEIVSYLRSHRIRVEVHDTICRQVSHRDEELRSFAAQFDKIVFVAGKKSSNGKMLYKVCKEVNDHTYFISKTDELQTSWFQTGDTVGVCGATSTPQWLMNDVKEVLMSW